MTSAMLALLTYDMDARRPEHVWIEHLACTGSLIVFFFPGMLK